MARHFFVLIAVLSVLAAVPYTVKSQDLTPEQGALLPVSNQVYVKLILPSVPATGKADRPIVVTVAPAFKNSLGIEFAPIPKGKSWLGGGDGKIVGAVLIPAFPTMVSIMARI